MQTYLRDAVDSTMDTAKAIAEKKKCIDQPFAVIARMQRQGRGRNGGRWFQPESSTTFEPVPLEDEKEIVFDSFSEAFVSLDNFYPVNFSFPEHLIKIPLAWISTVIGCAVFDTLVKTRDFAINAFPLVKFNEKITSLFMKWPNDIILKDQDGFKKICGILCESVTVNLASNQKEKIFLIGLGINFFHKPDIIENSASVIDMLFDSRLNSHHGEIDKLIISQQNRSFILKYFAEKLEQEILNYLCTKRRPEELRELALARSFPKLTMMSVNKKQITGEFLDLTLDGGLVLKGVLTPIYAGDVDVVEELVDAYLAIDLGNSRIHMSFKKNTRHAEATFFDITYDEFFSKNSYQNSIDIVFSFFRTTQLKKVTLAYTSVNTKEKTDKVIQSVNERLKMIYPGLEIASFQFTCSDLFQADTLKGNFVEKNLGEDRALKYLFCKKEAARENKSVLTFSLGTAFTCEGVNSSGTMIENFVAPGLQMSFRALHNDTAFLPLLTPDHHAVEANNKVWDQEVYMQRGVFLNVISTIIYIQRKYSPCQIYISGGNAEIVRELVTKFEPELHNVVKVKKHIETEMLISLLPELLKKK